MYSTKRNDHRPKRLLSVALSLLAISFTFGSRAFAAVKDSDMDGLTDEGEVVIYHTDPNNPDTDGDGVSDGQEIQNGTNPLDAADRIPLAQDFHNPGIFGAPEKFPWYFGRAAGILAFVILTASTVFGLVVSSRAFMKIVPGADSYELHRSLSLASIIAVVLHFGALLFDQAFKLTVPEALVPFFFSREGVTTSAGYDIRFPIALGIVAFYLIIILILTAEFRAKMPPKFWRVVHYASFAAYPLFLLHGFMSGTDSKEGWMKAIYALSVSLVAFLIIVRIVFRTLIPTVRKLRSTYAKDETPSVTSLS